MPAQASKHLPPNGHVIVDQHDGNRIGLYFPDNITEGVTVYWHGQVTKDNVVSTVRAAEQSWRTKSGAAKESVFAYGDTKQTFKFDVQDVSEGARTLSKLSFDACRIELCSSKGKLIVWANVVQGGPARPLEDAGENIGLAFPPRFDSNARAVLSHALKQTLPIGDAAAARLLSSVHQQLHTVLQFA